MLEELYTSGKYFEKNSTWHAEESPWKVTQILKMMRRHSLVPQSLCEVGCGTGEILNRLQHYLPDESVLWGYEISPQVFEICKQKASERLHFKLADIRREGDAFFDLLLVIDVFEHVEDYLGFLREIRPKSRYKLFHIPLDLSVHTILRADGLLRLRDWYGHLHYFTKETALRSLQDTGYEVLDFFYTAGSIEMPTDLPVRNLLRLPRKLLFALNKDLAARTLGGFRLMVLAR